MHRLFVAIDLPETIKKRVADIRCELPGAHWVAAEQLHLTLRFIGDADDPTLAAIKTVSENCEFSLLSNCSSAESVTSHRQNIPESSGWEWGPTNSC